MELLAIVIEEFRVLLQYLIFEVLKAVTMKGITFLDVTPCSLVELADASPKRRQTSTGLHGVFNACT
jgi:hypothetical protein